MEVCSDYNGVKDMMITDALKKDLQTPVLTDNREFRTESDITNRYFDMARSELEKFPKVNGLVKSKKFVEERPCPVCRSWEGGRLFVKSGFEHVRCRGCSHIFVRNMLKECILIELYKSSKVDDVQRERQTHQGLSDYWTLLYEKYLSAFEGLKLPNNRILDVGCGDGRFLAHAIQSRDLECYGLELATSAKEQLLNLLGEEQFFSAKSLEETEYPKDHFGLITLWGVLEHIVDPVGLLCRASEILAPNGFIFVLVPNIESRAYKVLGANTPTVNPRAHISFFSRKSMSECCSQAGLQILVKGQELPIIDLMYKYLDYSPSLVDDILKTDEAYYHTYIIGRIPAD